jgi:ferredoxin
MIANYGYEDGSGAYFITIDTAGCLVCEGRWCVDACPQQLFVIQVDDDDEEVAAVVEGGRRLLREQCAACKPGAGHQSLPCTKACVPGAISHSW